MLENFAKGSTVQTHSLTTVEYNYRTGIVTGPTIQKNDILRVPVRLKLDSGESKDMLLQPKNLTLTAAPTPTPGAALTLTPPLEELKECRCMFCGESLLLGSEEEAIAHMEVCPCLQEQLDDTDHQFTLPTSMK